MIIISDHPLNWCIGIVDLHLEQWVPHHLNDQYVIDLQSTHNYKGRLLDAEGELTSKPVKLDISGEPWQVLSLKGPVNHAIDQRLELSRDDHHVVVILAEQHIKSRWLKIVGEVVNPLEGGPTPFTNSS